MPGKFLCALAVLLTLSVSPWTARGADEVEGLKPGDKAPPFTLVGSDGKKHDLAEMTKKKKQVVVVAWFPKAFTGGCTAECTSFAVDGAHLKAFEVAYFTASCDPAEKNKAFAESVKADYPILSDPAGKVAKAYGVVDATRPVPRRWTFYIGTDGKILFVDKEVKAKTHAVDVAKKLALLGVAKRK